MKHKMKLLEEPFNEILNDKKTIEFRLNDEKRKNVKIGDIIEFSKLPTLEEKIEVEVMDLYNYPTFKELFSFLGYKDKELEEAVNGMYEIYSPENEKKYGALGIKIKKIN